MKAFEEWQLTSNNYMSPTEAWRAALEWITSYEDTDWKTLLRVEEELEERE